uniref:Uncharacterized protein n=1 Tax=Setaria italica TaxID=4555 RepID=K3ZBR1_SETIT
MINQIEAIVLSEFIKEDITTTQTMLRYHFYIISSCGKLSSKYSTVKHLAFHQSTT